MSELNWAPQANISADSDIPDAKTPDLTPKSLQHAAQAALSAADLEQKVALTNWAAKKWFARSLSLSEDRTRPMPDRPGRPEKPELLPPGDMKKRSVRSAKGRIALMHSIAHIELNAIDLAWDVVGRFAQRGQVMPRSFYDGWVQVALEEANHFSLLNRRLEKMGSFYGALPAHDGLWEAAQETGHSLTARLAVVPLVLEARGLDLTPALIAKMEDVGDEDSASIFRIIYRDEKKHVAIGTKWFRFLCMRNGDDPAAAFQRLMRKHFRGNLKPPFNDRARSAAGLTPQFYRSMTASGRLDG